jgi:hypothetical protein
LAWGAAKRSKPFLTFTILTKDDENKQQKKLNKAVDRMAGRRSPWTTTPLRPPSGHFGRSAKK